MRLWGLALAVVCLIGVASGAVINEPSFEGGGWDWDGWGDCDRTCTCGGMCSDCIGGVSSSWSTDGTHSAGVEVWADIWEEGGATCTGTAELSVYQTVDFTGVSQLKLDMHRQTSCFGNPCASSRSTTLSVVIGSTTVWSDTTSTVAGETWTDVEIDVSGYTGTHTLYLRNYITATDATDSAHTYHCDGYFDNLRTTVGTPLPVDLTNTTGMFWVNHSWAAGTGGVMDSYNVSINETWYNGTTDTFYNHTDLSMWWQWSNITVYAFNGTTGLSSGCVSDDVQLVPIVPTPINPAYSEGNIWINHTWVQGLCYSWNCVETQSYNISVNSAWYNNTVNPFYNDTELAYGEWSNITVYAYNNDVGVLNNTPLAHDVKVNVPAPPTPVGGAGSWDFFWVNHSWSAGSEPNTGVTDSYNYSITTIPLGGSPSTIWYNDSTNTSHNNSLGTHGWSNIAVWAWNDNVTSGLSDNAIYQNINIPKYTPPTPTYIHNETDPTNWLWVNYSWACDAGGIGLADSFNVSINGLWHNGTALCDNDQPVPEDSDFEDNSLMGWTTSGAYAWTPTAYGYESTYAIRDGFTGTATGSSTAWKTVTLDDYGSVYFDCKLNDGTLTVYNGSETLYEITGTYDWQNIRIDLTAGTSTLKFTYTRPASPTPENHVWIDNVVVRQRINGWYLEDTVQGDIAITVWSWNDTYGGLSEGSVYDSVYVNYCPTAPTPANLQHTTAMTHVTFTWDAGSGDVTDSYNVSANGVWTNGTSVNNSTVTFGTYGYGTANIIVYAYNNTPGTTSAAALSDSVTVSPPSYPRTGTLTSSMTACRKYCSHVGPSANLGEPTYLQYLAAATWDESCYYCGSTYYKIYRKSSSYTSQDRMYCPNGYLQRDETYVGYCSSWGNPLYLRLRHYGGCYCTPSTIKVHYVAYNDAFKATGEISCVDRVELKYYSRSEDEFVLIACQDGGTEYTFTIAENLFYKISFDGDEYDFYCEGPFYMDYNACYVPCDWKVVSLMDEGGYPVQNLFYAIYDHDDDVWAPKWTFTNDSYVLAGGLSPEDHNVTIYVRTFDGVYSYSTTAPGYGVSENITYTNFTIPIKYNLNVANTRYDGTPFFFAVAGVYNDDEEWSRWGIDQKGEHVTIGNVWGGPAWIYCTREGYQDYESYIMWDYASALVKDYTHKIYMDEVGE